MHLRANARLIREGLVLAACVGDTITFTHDEPGAVVSVLVRPEGSAATFGGLVISFDRVGHYELKIGSRYHNAFVFPANARTFLEARCARGGGDAALVMQGIAQEPRARLNWAPILAAHEADVDGGLVALGAAGMLLESYGYVPAPAFNGVSPEAGQ